MSSFLCWLRLSKLLFKIVNVLPVAVGERSQAVRRASKGQQASGSRRARRKTLGGCEGVDAVVRQASARKQRCRASHVQMPMWTPAVAIAGPERPCVRLASCQMVLCPSGMRVVQAPALYASKAGDTAQTASLQFMNRIFHRIDGADVRLALFGRCIKSKAR